MDARAIEAVLSRGAATSAQLQRELGASQPTISRALTSLGRTVLPIGNGRNTKYALRLDLPGIGSEWPVFEVDVQGGANVLGRLYSLHRDQYWFAATKSSHSSISDGLPFFLQDLRPQGFIGRAIPKRFPELGLPERVNDWTDAHVLIYLARRGDDCIGNILLGDETLQRYLQSQRDTIKPIDRRRKSVEYEKLAQAAIAGEAAGSSAGGEHPKFTCVVAEGKSAKLLMVKFSPAGRDPVSNRWFDLLVCEHLALEILKKHKLTNTNSSLHVTAERVFLETERFDRVGRHGRRGLISMAAIDDCLLGKRANWIATAKELGSMGKIGNDDLFRIRQIATFGRLIGNSDMHPGNLSFFWTRDEHFELAPVYDMLPMFYAPTAANVLPTRAMEPLLPTADSLDIWNAIADLATAFWVQVAGSKLVSSEFARIAAGNAKVTVNAKLKKQTPLD